MGTRATITSKGQITIPQEVRQRLGLKQGDQIEFVTENGVTVMKPARREANPFEPYRGVLSHFESKDEVNAWLGDLRDDA
ncbi:MAG: AbrB/MazE/SpoVT family DNA-binding domain-containing protein [Deinococcota bacterium]|jgi:AbrB family looped-hinge helix DNA binding protein|nr:AbrB/MazE/SpoVT family DNA-binding domain-containing protein [Deinococcota bacterium]